MSAKYDGTKITRTEKLLQQCSIILTLEKKDFEFENMLYEIGGIAKRGEEAEAEEKLRAIIKLSVALRGQVVKRDNSRLCSVHTA